MKHIKQRVWLGGSATIEGSKTAKLLTQQNNQQIKYDKGCYTRPVNTTNIIKDFMAEQQLQQI